MNKPDGGPAFPCIEARNAPNEGMSLRDYFAAAALNAVLMAAENLVDLEDAWLVDLKDTCDGKLIAKAAYYIADAMIAERGK